MNPHFPPFAEGSANGPSPPSGIAQAHAPQRGCLPQVAQYSVGVQWWVEMFCSIMDPQHPHDRLGYSPPRMPLLRLLMRLRSPLRSPARSARLSQPSGCPSASPSEDGGASAMTAMSSAAVADA